jgi:hypothetical protein
MLILAGEPGATDPPWRGILAAVVLGVVLAAGGFSVLRFVPRRLAIAWSAVVGAAVVLVPGLLAWPGAVSNLGGPTSCGPWALHAVHYADLSGCGAARRDVAIRALKLAPFASLAGAIGVALTVRLSGVYRRHRPARAMTTNPNPGA